jgi:hypothetical protein
LNVSMGCARLDKYSAEVSRGDPKATAEYNFWNRSDFAGRRRDVKRPSTWSLLVFGARFVVPQRDRPSGRENAFEKERVARNAKAS